MSEDIKDESGNIKQFFFDLMNNNLDLIHVYNCNTSIRTLLTFIEEIPDKIVKDDIISSLIYSNFLEKNKNIKLPLNLFNDIHEGKVLHPDTLGLSYGFNSKNRLKLYGGGFGMGHYHEVSFDRTTKEYVYTLLTDSNREGNDLYSHSNWNEFKTLIFNYIIRS